MGGWLDAYNMNMKVMIVVLLFGDIFFLNWEIIASKQDELVDETTLIVFKPTDS